MFADRLLGLPLIGESSLLARRVGLLSPGYEIVAQQATPQTPDEVFAFAIAQGLPATAPRGADRQALAIAAGFAEDPLPHSYTWFLQNDRLGEALLRASIVLGTPAQDGDDLAEALRLFREVGLEDVARRVALQLLLTGR
ncbi:hypothetical protein [Roseicyclus elongatus]|uniref:hypothetical protein n=1 Tax=Roseicyclus elongatus TaxID=159346 RepID=UPI0004B79891|nr:hypothetical protein [Roseibacterium elongatum]